ncbi:MAG TPA: glycosyl hydrolase [Chloroflexota bacterium]|nr:glycosyl hydrolase [Chloroflexota bacterium]
MRWRLIGPHRGGRVVAVAGHPTERHVFYFGACAGGVWKTTDGGTYWENVSDGYIRTAAIGALAVAPSDPAVLYAGTGETTIRGNVSHGDGVYKSTDSGKTWANVGLADTRQIAKIRVHPTNPDLLYVAALGHAWGPNDERGIFRSRDGGKSWEKILYRDDRTGAADLVMDPTNPRILYASLWQAQRTPFSLISGGPGSGLFRSTDGGDTWEELTGRPGLPTGVKGKIGVAVSPSQPGRIWALVEATDGALFRSDDGGETWQRLSEQGDLRQRAWYYMHIYADPRDADVLWVLNIQCWRSIDGGVTFNPVPTPHGDNHDLWIDPQDPLRMIEGNDGGACVSYNGGLSWSTLYNQPTAQMYHVTTDNQLPYRVYGSQQDNTAISIKSRSVNGVISMEDWYEPGGGESGYIAVKPDDPNIVYGGAIGSGFGNGLLYRYDHRTGQEQNITVYPEDMGMGESASGLRYRFQWTFPVEISPFDPNVLYVGSNQLLKSTNGGMSWEEISPDLTRNDVSKQQPSGGPITKDNTGAEVYGTIFAFVESPHQRGEFWVGTDDGLVQISRDGGKSWQNITPPDLPEWALISTLDVSRHQPGTAYIAATRYKWDDTKPYLYKTADYGQTWQKITGGIPEGEFTRVVREDPGCRGLLVAGTETGVYVSFDDGAQWQRLQGNLPVCPIYDLHFKGDDLLAATHGRSFWSLDDVTPLRQIAERGRPDGTTLYAPRPTMRFRTYQGYDRKPFPGVSYRRVGTLVVGFRQAEAPDGTTEERLLDAGQNPPNGVIVSYYLPEEPKGEATLTFLDEAGNELRRFTSKAKPAPSEPTVTEQVLAEGQEGLEGEPLNVVKEETKEPRVPVAAGVNRFVWNLRLQDAVKVPGDKSTEDQLAGPAVLPGRYQVRLAVDGTTLTQSFEITEDPRVPATAEDLRAQFDLLLKVRDKLSETHRTINAIRDLLEQIKGWESRLTRHGDEEGQRLAKAARDALKAVEDALIDPDPESPLHARQDRLNLKLALLSYFIDSADARPSAGAYDVYDNLSARIDEQIQRFRQIVQEDVVRFNNHVTQSGVPALVIEREAGVNDPVSAS